MHSFKKFQMLSRQFRDVQLSLLSSACPEGMDLKGLTMWGKLTSQTVAYSYKVAEDLANDAALREHWAELKDNAVLQLERVSATVCAYMEEAEELSAWERCQIFSLAQLVSTTFQDEGDAMLAKLAAEGLSDAVPASVSTETLAKLAGLS